jgi:hypothetical protein
LADAVDLPAPNGNAFSWTAPEGRWQLLAVSEDRLFDGSQVDFSGVPDHAPYVRMLDPDTVSEAAWRKLAQFRTAGGMVIAVGARPLNSEKEFPSAFAEAVGRRLFGAADGRAETARSEDLWSRFMGPFRPEEQRFDGQTWRVNARGGVGIFLKPEEVEEMPGILGQVLPPDMVADDASAPVRMTRRLIGGRDVYFVINDGPTPWSGTLHFGSARAGELLDLATGAIRSLADPADARVTLDGWGGVLLRLDGLPGIRLRPDRVALSHPR